jgi:diacylglycerol kinase (ATP)
MRTAFILNPNAGESVLAEQKIHEGSLETALVEIMRGQGIEPEIYYTTVEDPGRGIAAQLATERVELVVVVGGDGTIHSVAHGLIGSESVLGIIPAGTMNNLARSLGIPENLIDACALLTDGEVRTIDVGRINQHIFLEVAGVGLDAALFPFAEEVKRRGLLSTFTGMLNGLQALIAFKTPKMSLAFDGQKPRTYRAVEVTVCNAPYYGPHLNVAAEIYMNDGWLDVVIYTKFNKIEYIRHAISISKGRRILTPKTIHRRAKRLQISTSANEAVKIHADGKVQGSTPADIMIIPAALKIRVSKGPVLGLDVQTEHPWAYTV